MSFFSDIGLYLKHFFSGGGEDFEKLKQLNDIYKTFRPMKFRYITKERVITELFLNKMYDLFSALLVIQPLLEQTLFYGEEKREALYLRFFIETNLPEDIRDKKENFSKEVIWQRVASANNPKSVIHSIEKEFLEYKNAFNRSMLPNVEQEYNILKNLNELRLFNFNLFFSKFDSEFSKEYKPKYTMVNGEEIIEELKDLYYLIFKFPKKRDITDAFKNLYSKISETSAKKNAKIAQQALNKIFKLFAEDFSPDKILKMCQYIESDPQLRIKTGKDRSNILEDYRKKLDKQFQKNKQIVLEKFSQQSLMTNLKHIFQGKKLLHIEGYNDALSNTLTKYNFEQISDIQALKITKSFIFMKYEKEIKESINTLILEGFFSDKNYQKTFSNYFFTANELGEKVIETEKSIAYDTTNSFKSLSFLLSNYKPSATNTLRISKIINAINAKIRILNKQVAESLYHVATHLFEILRDYKTKAPQIVTNIKKIKSGANKEFIAKLVTSYKNISHYIKIINTFVEIDSDLKKE